MSVPRPLPKKLLKKLFLKVLYEHERPEGPYKGHAWEYIGIIRVKLAEFFQIPPLSEDEYAEGRRAVFELERDGYIMQDPTQSSDEFKVLTDKGRKEAKKLCEDMELPSVDIDQLLTWDDLREKVHDDYLAGDYESAIFKAFKLLEETVRSKAKLPPEVFGANLMSKAFNPNTGLLKHPDAQTSAEEEGFHLVMRGAIMWFKNPSSHRTVIYDDSVKAAQVLGLADLLLDMVDQCQFRSKTP